MGEATTILGTHNGHEYVDLGLPSGTMWATQNIGASDPFEGGFFFIWNYDTVVKHQKKKLVLEDDAHKHWDGEWKTPTKEQFQELIDNCKLKRLCGETDEHIYISGLLFTSKINNNRLFLPAAGYISDPLYIDVIQDKNFITLYGSREPITDKHITNKNSNCCYWSSSAYEKSSSERAFFFNFDFRNSRPNDPGIEYMTHGSCDYGHTIRPVFLPTKQES